MSYQIILGLGELGAVFARGLLRLGHPVVPVIRDQDPAGIARLWPDPGLALIATAETDLHGALAAIPRAWRDRVGLLQNELLPRDWRAHAVEDPTVISVWFEKKRGMDARVLLPSPACGPAAALLVAALQSIGIPAREVAAAGEMEWELVRKNLYILTSNIAGLEVGGTVSQLWDRHRELAERVADEVLAIQTWLTGRDWQREGLIAGMVEAFEADPGHGCTGRSAPGRLARALGYADEAGIAVPKLREIAARAGV